VPVPSEHVYRIAGEAEPNDAAQAYEHTLRAYFGSSERSFDLVLLGMGDDGHTASLFPGTLPVTEQVRWVMATHASGQHIARRITLTPVVLNAAAAVTFLVAGASKAARLAEALAGTADPMLPVQRIRPTHGSVTWLVDKAAAAQLREETPS
jgi:6-phosphogluconolactonase